MSSSTEIHAESISKLPLFFHNLELSNPNTVTQIKKDASHRLQMCFVAIGSVIYTFCTCMLPVVYVDIVPLKGEYLKSLFIALAMDGNHEELVLAFGVGGVDTVESSKWFLENLKTCLRLPVTEIGFITKMFGSISTALESVFPDSYRGFCYLSVITNIQDRYGHNIARHKLCKQTCKTYSMTDFQLYLSMLRNSLRLQNIWIEQFACHKWARAFFPIVRRNVLSMDIPEIIHMLAGETQSRPVTNFIEVILEDSKRTYLQRSDMWMRFGHITPYADNVLQRRIRKSQHWYASRLGDFYFDVNDFRETTSVCLERKSCLCGKWKHSGIPCGHAIAALRSLNKMNFDDVVDILCTSAIHRAAYATQPIIPLPPPDQWESPNEVTVLLPPM